MVPAPAGSFRRWRRHRAHFDEFEPEPGDPLHQFLKGALV